jgi:hypothetical protein
MQCLQESPRGGHSTQIAGGAEKFVSSRASQRTKERRSTSTWFREDSNDPGRLGGQKIEDAPGFALSVQHRNARRFHGREIP